MFLVVFYTPIFRPVVVMQPSSKASIIVRDLAARIAMKPQSGNRYSNVDLLHKQN